MVPVSFTIRLVLPFFVFTFPFYATLNVFFWDMIDSIFYRQAKINKWIYEIIDKNLDFIWYIVSLVYAYLSGFPYIGIFVALLVFRLIGQILYFTTRNEKYFIYFPNLYENIFILLVFIRTFPGIGINVGTIRFWLVVLVVELIKIVQEIVVHSREKDYYPFLPEWMKGPKY